MTAELDRAIETIIASLKSGGTLFACGNGGSEAHAGHLVDELMGRLTPDYNRRPIAAVHLRPSSCIANDFGWHEVYARQVEALCRPDDVLVVLSTSGQSENIGRAATDAVLLRVPTVALLGSRPLLPDVSMLVSVHSAGETTEAIQADHHSWLHTIARRVEEALCPRP